MADIYVFIDDEGGDKNDYEKTQQEYGFNLVEFSINEARERYDYVHRPSPSMRSAGQARNMFQDYAHENGIDFYCVIDDDTTDYHVRRHWKYIRRAKLTDITKTFDEVETFMRDRHIGLFGLPQTGDAVSEHLYLYRRKVMNTTFYLMPYLYRGERGVQDDDTSLFSCVNNEGYFTGSLADGLCLLQTGSAQSEGGLTDLYHECKLLNKALVCPIQFPTAIHAEKQPMNGARIHHKTNNRYLCPKILKSTNGRDNIAWDTYEEDVPFTNEPKRINNYGNKHLSASHEAF